MPSRAPEPIRDKWLLAKKMQKAAFGTSDFVLIRPICPNRFEIKSGGVIIC
jgi:hypothetical protein